MSGTIPSIAGGGNCTTPRASGHALFPVTRVLLPDPGPIPSGGSVRGRTTGRISLTARSLMPAVTHTISIGGPTPTAARGTAVQTSPSPSHGPRWGWASVVSPLANPARPGVGSRFSSARGADTHSQSVRFLKSRIGPRPPCSIFFIVIKVAIAPLNSDLYKVKIAGSSKSRIVL